MKIYKTIVTTVAVLAFLSLLHTGNASAHCDTLGGPVVESARAALEGGDITPVLKWVRPDKEDEIKTAFQETLSRRAQGGERQEAADKHFFETLVRIHRAGEGAPYTGLKSSETVDPAVLLADQSLASGTVDHLVNVLTNAMANGIRDRFQRVRANQKHADDSVAAGREFVESYVVFTHYIEGLHGQITGGSAHHGKDGH